eukprot:1196070-Prorocentrum_minimum.AAC.5
MYRRQTSAHLRGEGGQCPREVHVLRQHGHQHQRGGHHVELVLAHLAATGGNGPARGVRGEAVLSADDETRTYGARKELVGELISPVMRLGHTAP